VLIDSHCHFNLMNAEDYHLSTDQLVQRAADAGVERMLCVGTNTKTSRDAIAIAGRFPNVYASAGIHPSDVYEDDPNIDAIVSLASDDTVIAVGETGLDYYYNKEGLDLMRQGFRNHIRAASVLKKPIIIHTRDAREDTITIMKEEGADTVGGVMHCFTETMEMAEEAMALGFYISFSGIVTFKNAKSLQAVAQAVPLDRMLIETDSPYLTPSPYRGKLNHPEYVRYVAEKIAELRSISYDEVVAATGENFFKCFRISK
jgi:TatD DNase family protein